MESADLDNLIKRYHQGESIGRLAKERRIDHARLRNLFVSRGVQLRTASENALLIQARKRPYLNAIKTEELARRYLEGESIASIAASLKVSGESIQSRLARRGIQFRSLGEIQQLKWQQMAPEDKARHAERTRRVVKKMWANMDPETKAARLAKPIAGLIRAQRPMTHEERLLLAASRERNLSEVGAGETDLLEVLTSRSVACTPQKAIGTYNVDISLDEFSIAVEIDAANFYRTRCGERACLERVKYLLNQGWCVLYVLWMNRNQPLLFRDIASKIITLLDVARSGEPVIGKYGVINRKGETMTTPRSYLDGIARIPGF